MISHPANWPPVFVDHEVLRCERCDGHVKPAEGDEPARCVDCGSAHFRTIQVTEAER